VTQEVKKAKNRACFRYWGKKLRSPANTRKGRKEVTDTRTSRRGDVMRS